MKLEGAEEINQLEELATLVKQSMENVKHSESPKAKVTLQNAVGSVKTHR
jgi:TATA-box binding protein (TBP) (component of TFIID and TFIIIB)